MKKNRPSKLPWYFFLCFFLFLAFVGVAVLSAYLTKQYIKHQIVTELTSPVHFAINNTNQINEKICHTTYSFLDYPNWHGEGLDEKKNCFNCNFAQFLAILCENVSITNCFESDDILLPKSFSSATVLKINTQKPKYGYIFYSSQYRTTFLIWSGTSTLKMWEQDMKTDLVPMPNYITPPQYKTDKLLVHRGFLHIYEQTRDQILNTYSKLYKDKSDFFVIAGHSLGGGISPISAFDLLGNSISTIPTIIYTFGAPRCGNISFSNDFKLLPNLQSTMRIFNTEDVVPMLPPAVSKMQYTHVDFPIAFTVNLGSVGNNHIDAYLYNLPKNLTPVC